MGESPCITAEETHPFATWAWHPLVCSCSAWPVMDPDVTRARPVDSSCSVDYRGGTRPPAQVCQAVGASSSSFGPASTRPFSFVAAREIAARSAGKTTLLTYERSICSHVSAANACDLSTPAARTVTRIFYFTYICSVQHLDKLHGPRTCLGYRFDPPVPNLQFY